MERDHPGIVFDVPRGATLSNDPHSGRKILDG